MQKMVLSRLIYYKIIVNKNPLYRQRDQKIQFIVNPLTTTRWCKWLFYQIQAHVKLVFVVPLKP